VAIAAQPPNNMSPEDVNIPRFPILEERQGKDDRQTYYKIAFPGRSGTKSAEQITAERARVASTVNASGLVEILFLIDGTASMSLYYGPVTLAIERFAETLGSAGGEAQFRFAAAVYGDYDGPADPASAQFKLIAPFGEPGAVSHLSALRLAPGSKPLFDEDPNNDYPESVGAALLRASQISGWGSASARIVVLIGDHGNRLLNEPFTNKRDRRSFAERVTPEQVSTQLMEKGIAFTAVNVRGDYHKVWNDRFRQFAAAVFDGMHRPGSRKHLGFAPVASYDEAASQPDESKVEERVLEKLKELLNFTVVVPEFIAQTVTAPAKGQEYLNRAPLPVAEFTRAFFERRNITEQQLAELYGQRQLVETGYVSKFSREGMPQIAFWLAIDSLGFQRLRGVTAQMCDILDRRYIEDGLEDLAKRLVENMAGEDYDPKERLSVYLNRVLFIPESQFSEVLRQPVAAIAAWYEDVSTDDAKRNTFKDKVCQSATNLKFVENGKLVSRLVYEPGIKDRPGRWVPSGPLKEFLWIAATETGASYYFIPITYLP